MADLPATKKIKKRKTKTTPSVKKTTKKPKEEKRNRGANAGDETPCGG
jgi:hypothetical protein